MKPHLLRAAWLLAACLPASLFAWPDEPGRATSESPYFQVLTPTEPGVDALPLKDTQVDVTIAGVIAEVVVVQTYANAGAVPLEARYVFPGSTRAAVHGLAMIVGDRVVRAQIQTRSRARQTYETAKSEGKTAALLEQHRPNVFGMNLANILPGEIVRVELRYTELLEPAEGTYAFVFPTVVGPRYVSDRRELGDDDAGAPGAAASRSAAESWTGTAHLPPGTDSATTFGFTLQLAAGLPIAHLACDTHPIRIDAPRPDLARLALDPGADPTTHADRDIIVHYRLRGGAVQAGLLTSRDAQGGDGYFLALVQPPARVEPTDIPPRDYVFIVDVSGSMHGFPLQTAKHLLGELIAAIRPTDTFNVLLFSGSASTLAPAPLPATPENLARAIVLLERRPAGGGTELLPALRSALALPRPPGPLARTFVVVTDGYVTVEAEALDLVRAQLDRANLFAFGIGTSVNRHLIEGLARAGQGEPFVVTQPDDALAAAARFRRYIESPVLVGVRATFDGVQAADLTPAPLPDLFAERPVVLFGRWTGGPGGTLRIEGQGGAGAFASTLDFAAATPLEDSRALELLWARAQVRALEDRELDGSDPERVSAITQLGLRHGLLTKHTSFVAVDEVVRNTTGAPHAVKQPVPLPAGVDAAAVGGQAIATTPEPATVGLVLITLVALAWVGWRLRGDAMRAGARS